IRERGKPASHAPSARRTGEPLQAVIAPFTRLDRIAATARTLHTIGPAHLSQVIGSFLVILQVGYQKILTSRSPLERERKQVTVLFADLKGFMALLAGRDPEETR